MKLRFLNFSIVFAIICMLLLSNVTARPHNRWHATDPRCSGGAATSYRLKRSAGTNNSGQYWKFNGNSGSCMRHYQSPLDDHTSFYSQNECDEACLNIYHFG